MIGDVHWLTAVHPEGKWWRAKGCLGRANAFALIYYAYAAHFAAATLPQTALMAQ